MLRYAAIFSVILLSITLNACSSEEVKAESAPSNSPVATPAPTAVPTPTASVSNSELLTKFGQNLKKNKLDQVVLSYRNNYPTLVIVEVSSSVLDEPKEVQLQFAQKLWDLWAEGCASRVRDIDDCRISVRDASGKEFAKSSMLDGGSKVKLK